MPIPRPEHMNHIHEMFRGVLNRSKKNNLRDEYKAAGFEVVRHGELKKEPFIEVKMTEAKVDRDFYDRGDKS